jgi:hypothetical protein
MVGRQAPAVCRSKQAELLDLRGCGSRVHAKERPKSRRRRLSDCLRRDGASSWTRPGPGRHAPPAGSPKRPASLAACCSDVCADVTGIMDACEIRGRDPY